MINYKIEFGGHEIELDGDGVLWLPEKRILAVSDIHFEKSSFFGRFGTFLPPYETMNDLQRIYEKINFYKPDIFIALGDSFHDAKAYERINNEEKNLLNNVIGSVGKWVWIKGNHDGITVGAPGEYHDKYFSDDIKFTHMADMEYQGPEISGHYHPKVKMNILGQNITAPCFLVSENKIIMPSFGSYTGGLYINHNELQKLMPENIRKIFAIKQGKVFYINDNQ